MRGGEGPFRPREGVPMALAVEQRTPPDRGLRYFIANQNHWSWLALGLGIATLLMMLLGPLLVLNSHGWTQECPEGVFVR